MVTCPCTRYLLQHVYLHLLRMFTLDIHILLVIDISITFHEIGPGCTKHHQFKHIYFHKLMTDNASLAATY